MKNVLVSRVLRACLFNGALVCLFVLALGCFDNRRSNVSIAPASPSPTVSLSATSVSPASGSVNVVLSAQVVVSFSESIDPKTVSESSMKLLKNGLPIACVFTTKNTDVTLIPVQLLDSSSLYTGVITTLVKSVAGNALQQEYRWSFTTASQLPPQTYPVVTSTTPSSNATNVSINAQVSVTFSEPILASSANTTTFSVSSGTMGISGMVSLDTTGKVLTFVPSTAFSYTTVYIAVVSTAVKDLSGNALQQEYRWSFTTASQLPPQTYPVVTSTTPSSNATNVSVATQVTAVFNEAILPSTANATAFKVYSGNTEVMGTVSLDTTGKVLTFIPSSSLVYTTVYSAVVGTSVKNLSGNALQQEYRWSFTTAANSTPTPVTPFTLDTQYHAVNVATDDVGNVYAYGYFGSPIPDVFVAKFAPNGSLVWNTAIATPDIDWPQGGIVATHDHVYVQRYRQASGGSGSTLVFVDALASSNGALLWSTQTDSGSMPSALTNDGAGNIYATNTSNTVKLDATGAIVSRSTSGGRANTFAFQSFFFAGTSYVDATNLSDRVLTRTDATLVPTWTEWRRDTFNQDVIALAVSSVNQLLFVAEDSYTATASSVTFQPIITAYTIAGGGTSASIAWTKPLVGGRVTAAAAGPSGLYVMLDGVPPSLQKLDISGSVVWTVPISQGGLGIATYADTFVYVTSGSSILVFDTRTGVKQ